MISFFHPNLNKGKPLVTRLSPTRVNWVYNLNTNVINTYGGQVVQLLGINYDQLTIYGIFGQEGPHGKTKLGLEPKNFWDYTNIDGNPYSIGLTQLTAYFQDYFTIASQGASDGTSTRLSGNFNQIPMIITYKGHISFDEGNLDSLANANTHTGMWSVYPVNFPSYSRALEQFAPQFQITFEVEEANTHADTISTLKAIDHIKKDIGFNMVNINPLNISNQKFDVTTADSINQTFSQFLPPLDLQNIDDAAIQVASGPTKATSAYKAGYNISESITSSLAKFF